MHDCSVRTGDRWMKKHFDRYARWAPRHNSLLIVTFDENAGGKVKPIFTIIVGAKVRPGVYAERLNHYKLLGTIEASYGLSPARPRQRRTPPVDTLDELTGSAKQLQASGQRVMRGQRSLGAPSLDDCETQPLPLVRFNDQRPPVEPAGLPPLPRRATAARVRAAPS
jgi:hypothetical protein